MGVNKQRLIDNKNTKKRPRFTKPYITEKETEDKKTNNGKNTFNIKLQRRKSKNKKYTAKATIKDNGDVTRKGKRLRKDAIPDHIPKKSLKRIIKVDKDTKAYVFKSMTRIETTKIKETKAGDQWQIVADVKTKNKLGETVTRRFGSKWQFHSNTINKNKIKQQMKQLMAKIEQVYEPLDVKFKINYYRPNANF